MSFTKDSRSRALALLGLCLVSSFLSCGDAGDTVTPPPNTAFIGDVALHFEFTVGGQALTKGSIQYTNAAGNEFSVQTLKFYLSNFRLQGPDGNHSFDTLQLINAFDSTTHTVLLKDAPERHYHDVVFTFGLDDSKNIEGSLPGLQENIEMQWPVNWGGGYHYMKIEGQFRTPPSDSLTGFVTHTGRFWDQTTNELFPHHFRVLGSPHFNIIRNTTRHITITMDVSKWYETPNTINLTDHAGNIMNNTAAQNLLQENGADVFSVQFLDEDDDILEPHQ